MKKSTAKGLIGAKEMMEYLCFLATFWQGKIKLWSVEISSAKFGCFRSISGVWGGGGFILVAVPLVPDT